jgi:hypothetical protein
MLVFVKLCTLSASFVKMFCKLFLTNNNKKINQLKNKKFIHLVNLMLPKPENTAVVRVAF